jgi:hypothetical protein
MFHDDLMHGEERARFHDAYGRLADAVSACLGMFLWAAEGVRAAAYADRRDIHVTPLMLMLDFAEAIDGVSVLARSGSAKNCSQPLRTALEVQLSLEYILEHKDTYERRCLAYEFYHLRDKLRWAQRCDPTSPVGKQLRAELAGDQLAGVFDVTGVDLAREARDLEERMNSPRYADVQVELARMKAGKLKDGGWFSLWDGPKNVRGLALHLKKGAMYEALYRAWSSVTHGEGAIKRVTGKKGDELRLCPIRSPEGLPTMCRNACQLSNVLTLVLVDGLVPHLREEMERRYVQDVKPRLAFIEHVKGL